MQERRLQKSILKKEPVCSKRRSAFHLVKTKIP